MPPENGVSYPSLLLKSNIKQNRCCASAAKQERSDELKQLDVV